MNEMIKVAVPHGSYKLNMEGKPLVIPVVLIKIKATRIFGTDIETYLANP